MSKERQDAWSKENDLLLADTVLRHIRGGSTQLKAFEEVGDRLNRTSAACGFRWNAIVRDQYEQAIEIAKKQRKERRRMNSLGNEKPVSAMPAKIEKPMSFEREPVSEVQPETSFRENETTLASVIDFLKKLNEKGLSSDGLEDENERLGGEIERLQKENVELKKRLSRMEKEHETVKEDYQSVIQIMERARKMVVLKEDGQDSSSFRMDKNGNLEKVAK